MGKQSIPLDIQMIQDKLRVECQGDRAALSGSDLERLVAWESASKRERLLEERAQAAVAVAAIPARMLEDGRRRIAQLRKQGGQPALLQYRDELQQRMAMREAHAARKQAAITAMLKRHTAELQRARDDLAGFKSDKSALPQLLQDIDAAILALNEPFSCRACGNTFRSKTSLDRHKCTAVEAKP